MTRHHYFVIVSLLFLIPVSCEKSPKLTVSSKEVIFDAYPDEPQTINISATGTWTVRVIPLEDWLTVEPTQGKGDGMITLTADENAVFVGRTVQVAVSGEDTQTDTIRVIQTAGIDIAEEIEDEIFKQYCLEICDHSPQDGKLSLKEVKSQKTINIKKMEITSLVGIEYFTNLENLDCSFNSLKSFDISANTNLKNLDCSYNSLESIDISQNKELLSLNCSYNPIATIDVAENVKLTELTLYFMELTGIDVRHNTALRFLGVSYNNLTTLDVQYNKELDGLHCNETHLTNLNISENTKLRSLYCVNNQLTVLNTGNNPILGVLWCSDNPHISLNLSQNAELEELACARNSLQTLDISKNVKLKRLFCETNQITALNFNNNKDVTDLMCNSNNLTGSIELNNNRKLQRFNFRENPSLKTIYVWSEFQMLNVNNDDSNTEKEKPFQIDRSSTTLVPI